MEFGRYWVPGPTEVHPDVLRAMQQPMLYHRTPEVQAIFARIQPGLQAVFGTEQPVLVLTSSGTGAVEAGLRAIPRGRVLSLVNGAFSARSAEIAEACGHEVDRAEVALGQRHEPSDVKPGYDAITVVHNETSTGALQDLRALARAAGDTPLLVDSVSGAGGAPVEMDAAGLAYACTGSQKALALPPGLAFAVASPSLLERAADAPARGFYLDLRRYADKQPPYTPGLPVIYALEAQLERLMAEGIEARWARHRAMAERTWAWASEHGLDVLAPEPARSPTVTCLRLPTGLDGPTFVARLAERGFTIGTGYGELKPTTFRIGHMGDQSLATLEPLLAACADALH